jgi:hypothetical protein
MHITTHQRARAHNLQTLGIFTEINVHNKITTATGLIVYTAQTVYIDGHRVKDGAWYS